ncbi:MAG: hypothetical protein AAB036_07475 [Elusimicrobiota bacterium]
MSKLKLVVGLILGLGISSASHAGTTCLRSPAYEGITEKGVLAVELDYWRQIIKSYESMPGARVALEEAKAALGRLEKEARDMGFDPKTLSAAAMGEGDVRLNQNGCDLHL